MGKPGEKLAVRIELLRKNWIRDEDPMAILDMVIEAEKIGYERKNLMKPWTSFMRSMALKPVCSTG